MLVTDDRSVYPVRVPINGGSLEPLMAKPIVVTGPSQAAGCSVVISGSDSAHNEIYAVNGGALHSSRIRTMS